MTSVLENDLPAALLHGLGHAGVMLVIIFIKTMADITEFPRQVYRKSSLVLLLVALVLLVIAGAGLLQCWCSYTLKTMIDRDKICVRDILITFETKYFYFCLTERSSFCSAARPSSCWSDAGHLFT